MDDAINNMKCLTMLLFLALVNAAMTQPAQAAMINAASCSSLDVTSAIAASANGDIVNIPAGTCSWSSTVSINKGITLQGAGEGVTIIQDNVNKGLASNGCSGNPLMTWTVNSPNSFRITAFTIVGVATDPDVCQKGHLSIRGSTHTFRIDHLTFDPPQTVGIFVLGDLWGLVDHITFTGHFKNMVRVEHQNWNGTSGDLWGDQSWAQPLNIGTAEGVYVEDSTITDTSETVIGQPFDCFSGGRLIIRYNTMYNSNFGSHGADSDQRHRGCRWYEIYSNNLTYGANLGVPFAAWIRGGTGVFHDNSITAVGGLNAMVQAVNCRDTGARCGGGPNYTPWGTCDGTGTWDQNSEGGSGYRCVDQPGSGTSNLVSGNPASPAAWIGNISDPIYVWNNTRGGLPNNTVSASSHVQSNRDYFTGTPRPGYTPYTYPHPLQGGGPAPAAPSSPAAPSNLKVSP